MNQTTKLIREYLVLFRTRLMVHTAFIPVTGALAMGMTQTLHLIVLFILGCLYHIRGMVANDYFDCELDKNSPYILNKPLAKGTISKTSALIVIFLSLFLYWLIIGLFFLNVGTVLMAVAAPLFGNIYNIAGKKFIGSDIILAVSILCNCLLGVFSVEENLTPVALSISLIWALDWLYFTPIAGLKDLEIDHKSGAKTLPIFLGVTVRDDRLIITWPFKVIVSFIKLAQIILIGIILMSPQLKESYFHSPLLLSLILIGACLMIYATFKLFSSRTVEKERAVTLATIKFITNFLLIFLLLTPLTGYSIIVFIFFFSMAWIVLFNLIIYGNPFQLLVPKKKAG